MKVESTQTGLMSLWIKIPVIVRAILIGLIISTVGIYSWALVALSIPMPWSFIVMLGLLGLFIKYFSGSWAPSSTREFRKENFRKTTMSQQAWITALIAALLIVAIEQSGLVVTFRIIQFPAELFITEYSFLQSVPVWAAWLFIIMISMVAGVCEEIGFRGFMQRPLEKKYGPVLAIAITSVVFVLVHLHQAWSGPIIFHIFAVSVLFGAIAYYSGSLIPGIIGHIIMDVFNFSFWWSDLGNQFNKTPISSTGMDTHFVVWCVILVVCTILFIRMMGRLSKINRP